MRAATVAVVLSFAAGCGHGDLTSTPDSDESHNRGKNCLRCHNPDDEVEFELAGTAWELDGDTPHRELTVMVHTEPEGGGDLIAVVEADRKGNFYTTDAIPWEEGLYVSVLGRVDVRYMETALDEGGCNGCHDDDEEPRLMAD